MIDAQADIRITAHLRPIPSDRKELAQYVLQSCWRALDSRNRMCAWVRFVSLMRHAPIRMAYLGGRDEINLRPVCCHHQRCNLCLPVGTTDQETRTKSEGRGYLFICPDQEAKRSCTSYQELVKAAKERRAGEHISECDDPDEIDYAN